MRIGRAGLFIALAAYILPYGAVDALSYTAAAGFVGITAAIAAVLPAKRRATRLLSSEVLVLAALLALFVLSQAWSFDGNIFANDIWQQAKSFTNTTTRAISVQPSSTYAALFALLGPFFAYFSVIRLYDSDRDALGLLKIIAAIGCLFSLHGLVQMLAFPEGFLLPTRTGGTHLTGIFINRNNAGTFLGIACLASLGWLVAASSSAARASSRFTSDSRILVRHRQTILAGTCLAICLLCLFLTRSRGALLSWALALGLTATLLALNHSRLWPGLADVKALPSSRLIRAALALAAVFMLFQFMGDRLAARLQSEGVDGARLCVYSATFRAFRDNWVFGTGLGTFSSVFPQYREAGCVPSQLVVLRAHSFFLEALLTMGAPALAFLLYIYARISILLTRGYRARNRMRYAPIIGVGGVVFVTTHSLLDFSLQVPGVAVYFACFLGSVSIVSLGRQGTSATSRSSTPEAAAYL